MEESKYIITKSDKRIYNVASFTVIVLAISSAVLSYSALYELAVAAGIDKLLAYLFPVTIDGLILSGSLLVLFAANRGRRSWGGLFLTALGVVSSIAGNVAVSPQNMTAQLVHAAAPVVLFLSLEATTSLIRQMQREKHKYHAEQKEISEKVAADALAEKLRHEEKESERITVEEIEQKILSQLHTQREDMTVQEDSLNTRETEPYKAFVDSTVVGVEESPLSTFSPREAPENVLVTETSPTDVVEPVEVIPVTPERAPVMPVSKTTPTPVQKVSTMIVDQPKPSEQSEAVIDDVEIPTENADGKPMSISDKVRYVIDNVPHVRPEDVAKLLPQHDGKYVRKIAKQHLAL